MNVKKTLAGVLTGTLTMGAALVAVAAPASATDFGPKLTGDIYMFTTAGGWDANTYAGNLVTGGDGVARPFQSATTSVPCPAGTAQVSISVQIPQAGVPQTDWDSTALVAASTLKDAEGRFYTGRGDNMGRATVVTYLNTRPNGSGTLPVDFVCMGAGAGEIYGYFETMMTASLNGGTDKTTMTWSVPAPVEPAKPASSTELVATPASVTAGDSVHLAATVSPSSATGDVEFLVGSTVLGTATLAGGAAAIDTVSLPVGTSTVTAHYKGGSNAQSSGTASVVVAPAPAKDTVSTLVATPVAGDAFAKVTLTCTVAPAGAGSVRFFDGTTPLGTAPVSNGVAMLETNALGAGAHSLTCAFVPADAALFNGSTSAAIPASYVLAGAVDEQTVVVTIPVGTITITTPYTPASPLDLGTAILDASDSTYSASAPFSNITITDTRSGNLGFTASVVSGAFQSATGDSFGGNHAGLTGLTRDAVNGNATEGKTLTLTDRVPFTDGLGSPKVFAQYPAGQSVGTVAMHGVFGIDQVPTSVTPGLYTATVTFTAV